MSGFEQSTIEETIVTTCKPAPGRSAPKPRTKRQPQFMVVVLNDDDHTYAYVIDALMRVCGHTHEQAFRLAEQIDCLGIASVWTGSKEAAELKRDQIRGFGPDFYTKVPITFPLGCYIEPIA